MFSSIRYVYTTGARIWTIVGANVDMEWISCYGDIDRSDCLSAIFFAFWQILNITKVVSTVCAPLAYAQAVELEFDLFERVVLRYF